MTQTTIPATCVAGLSCRTNHKTQGADIGALWQRVAQAGLLTGQQAVAVYHDYRLLEDGFEVTVTVGTETTDETTDETTPEHISRVAIPQQPAVQVETDGSIAQVQAAWQTIWGDWPDGGPRAFVADMERWMLGPDGKPVSATVIVGLRR